MLVNRVFGPLSSHQPKNDMPDSPLAVVLIYATAVRILLIIKITESMVQIFDHFEVFTSRRTCTPFWAAF